MYLKSLEINGFKSFAKKSNLEFNSPITAIVGPNGSGKSNVAEAFRFVLGEQSIKSLRGKRGEDLIYNGSGNNTRASRASVRVAFDNSNRILDLDFDEVSIERIVHRDGANEYYINGSAVRLKDVLELLAGAHIGSSGHHIISQGEADRILNANSKDRKVMIEDALGLRIYHYKISESQKKLTKTEENIKEVGLLRKEIGPHLRFLKKQVEKIEQTEKLREDLSLKYKEYLKREKTYIDFHTKQIESDLKEPLSRQEDLNKELEKARQILERSDVQDEKSQRVIELEDELKNIRNKKEEVLRQIGQIEGEIRSYRKIVDREKDSLAQDDKKTIKLSEVESFGKEIESYVTSAENENDISSIKDLLSKIKITLNNFFSQNEEVKTNQTIVESEHEISLLENRIQSKNEELKKINEEDDNLQESYLKTQKEIEEDKDKNRDAEKNVFKIQAEQNQVTNVISDLRNRQRQIRSDEEMFQQEIREGMVLVGQSISDFAKSDLSEGEIISEERRVQVDRKHEIEKIKIRLEDAGIGASDDILKEFKETSERDEFLIKELSDLENSKSSLLNLVEDLESELSKQFNDGLNKINTQFQEFFGLMFGGGNAKLSLVKKARKKTKDEVLSSLSDEEIVKNMEEEEEAEEGIEIVVSLPRKKIKGLMMLSGGERALTSIALIFSMSQVNPPPFIILDETDAALDEANSRKYGDMVAGLSKHSQLILITHNRETMSRAGVLYGVTMDSSGVSKLLSVHFDEAVAVAK